MNTFEKPERKTLFSMSLAALGIVYGDIGTSPLYAMRESLRGASINETDVLGVLSLIFWSLTLLISIKYLFILFRADNEGEGGILALLALITRTTQKKAGLFFIIGIIGAGLMIGDGMLTPAISVISAIEGLNIIIPSLSQWILPLTVILLILLFSFQYLGTARIGIVFGPVLMIWFITIAVLGLIQIMHNPVVLYAVNPKYAFLFMQHLGFKGYAILGSIFLVITGGEALYADLGHFGPVPIRLSWFFVAFPALILNYFGQGAYVLVHPEGIINPFYSIAPDWFSFPLLVLATAATIIASQAVISATFSLIKQAILLGLYPHMPIIQTSDSQQGQIYIPQVNLFLALGTLSLIFIFKNSNAMAHAYGVAVNLEILLTLILVIYVAVHQWKWSIAKVLIVFTTFVLIDFGFLGANLEKIITGGWLPIVFGALCAFIMYTWNRGRLYLKNTYYLEKDGLSQILNQLDYKELNLLPNTTAIFITDIYDKSGGSFLHFLKLSRALPEHILLVNYSVENIPHVLAKDRFQMHCLKENICELTLHYGFMDIISIPQALYVANDRGFLPFNIDIDAATYFMEIPTIVPSKRNRILWFFWQEKLFAFLVRNYSANLNIEFYQLPYNRTVALGTYYLI